MTEVEDIKSIFKKVIFMRYNNIKNMYMNYCFYLVKHYVTQVEDVKFMFKKVVFMICKSVKNLQMSYFS
jgi:hypothetical protein